MVNDFTCGPADGNATLSLSGLTVGAQSVTTWYNRGWGAPGGRVVFMTASDTPGGFYRIDQNFSGDGNGNVIRYAFTANATTQTFARVSNRRSRPAQPEKVALQCRTAAPVSLGSLSADARFNSPVTPFHTRAQNVELLAASLKTFHIQFMGWFLNSLLRRPQLIEALLLTGRRRIGELINAGLDFRGGPDGCPIDEIARRVDAVSFSAAGAIAELKCAIGELLHSG